MLQEDTVGGDSFGFYVKCHGKITTHRTPVAILGKKEVLKPENKIVLGRDRVKKKEKI